MHIHWGKSLDAFENQHRSSLYPRSTKLVGGILNSPCLSVHLYVCRRHGFWCVTQLLWNFNLKFHMHVACGYGQKPLYFQRCHFQNGRLADSSFSWPLYIKSKLHWHITFLYGKKPINFQQCHFQNGRLATILDFSVSGLYRWHGFQCNSSFIWNFNFKFHVHVVCGNGYKRCHFQNGRLVAILYFSESRLLLCLA